MSYYAEHRDVICARAREFSKRKWAERKQYLADHPEAVEEEREKNRQRYLLKRANRIRRQLEDWMQNPSLSEVHRATISEWLKNDTYKTLKPSALRSIGTFLSLQ